MSSNISLSFILLFLASIIELSCDGQKEHLRPRTSGAAEALDMWSLQRSFPADRVNTKQFQRAFHDFNKFEREKTTRENNGWEPLGPMNVGGRTLCLAFNPLNPNTIYAGSASGGLWRSFSGGTGAYAWHRIETGFPVMGVAAIAIDPFDSNTIYIGTGEVYNYQETGNGVGLRLNRGTYGIGLLKSMDGGTTWQKSLDWSYDDLRGVQDIRINKLKSSSVWAATSEGTYRSYDGGVTWMLVYSVLMANEIVFHPVDTSILFVSCGNLGTNGYGIYRTLDGGNTFTKITQTLLTGKITLDIAVQPPYALYGSFADWNEFYGLFSSDDLGDTWRWHTSEDYSKWQGWYSHDVAINPSDTNHIMCSGIDLWKSTNGGDSLIQKTWYYLWDFSATPIGGPEGPPNYIHGDIHRIYFHPTNHDTIYFATDGGVFRSKNGGETFEGLNGRYQTTQFYADFSNSEFDSVFAVGGMQDNATAIYEGALNWRRVVGGDGMNSIIDPTNDDIVYCSYQWGNILKSTDHAVNFTQLNNLPTTNNANFVSPYILCPVDHELLFAGTEFLYSSPDGGTNWNTLNSGQPIDGNPILRIASSPSNCDLLYITTAPTMHPQMGVHKSTDGGLNWTNVTAGLPNRFPMDIVFDPTNDLKLWVVFSGFGTDHVWKTINGGASWISSSIGLPDVPTHTLVIDPVYPNFIYVGNDLGVYVSADTGASWLPWSENLVDATFVMDLSISPVNRKLRLASHGQGVWERKLMEPQPSLAEEENIAKFHPVIWPNPAIEFLFLKWKTEVDFPLRIEIYNIGGNTKIVKTVKSKSAIIQLENLEPGSYCLNVSDMEGRVISQNRFLHF